MLNTTNKGSRTTARKLSTKRFYTAFFKLKRKSRYKLYRNGDVCASSRRVADCSEPGGGNSRQLSPPRAHSSRRLQTDEHLFLLLLGTVTAILPRLRTIHSSLYQRRYKSSLVVLTQVIGDDRTDLSLPTGSNRIARRQSSSVSGGRVLKARPHDLEGRRLSALFQYPLLPFGSVFCRSRAGDIFRNRLSRVKHAVIISWLCLAPPRHGVGPRRPSLTGRC